MILKVANIVFSSQDQPVMVVLSNEDIEAIKRGSTGSGVGLKHASAPSAAKKSAIDKLMSAKGAQRVRLVSVQSFSDGSVVIHAEKVAEGN